MRLFAVLMTVCLSQVAIFAGPNETRFLRVELKEYSQHPENPTEVKLRLPLTMFSAIKGNFNEAFNEAGFAENYAMWSAAWQEVVAQGPMDFVEIKDGDSNFKLSTTATHLVIEAQEVDELETVNIRIPLLLGSVFFDGERFPTMEEIIFAVSELPTESLLEVTGEQLDMRVWIE